MRLGRAEGHLHCLQFAPGLAAPLDCAFEGGACAQEPALLADLRRLHAEPFYAAFVERSADLGDHLEAGIAHVNAGRRGGRSEGAAATARLAPDPQVQLSLGVALALDRGSGDGRTRRTGQRPRPCCGARPRVNGRRCAI